MTRVKPHIAIVWLLLIFMGGAKVSAQVDRKFEEESLESYRADPSYDYGLEPGPEPPPEQKSSQAKERKLNAGRIGKWIMYIIIGIAFVLIAGLLIRQYGNFRKPNKNLISSKSLEIEEIEDLQELDFDKRIAAAEERGDFRQAVRWQFLRALKRLNDRKLINWQKNKTNRDYSYEIKNAGLREQFDRISLVFEHVWYGEFPTHEANYQRMQGFFQQFIKQVK